MTSYDDRVIRLRYTVHGRHIVVETHQAVDIDEVAALWLFLMFATRIFIEQYCPTGLLQLGIGDGPFNEHPQPGQPRKPGCCTTLMAQALGVYHDLRLRDVIGAATLSDAEGTTRFDFARVGSYGHFPRAGGKGFRDPTAAIAWMLEGLDDLYYAQCLFLEALTDIKARAQRKMVWHPPLRRKLNVGWIELDNPRSRAAAWQTGLDILIQQWSQTGDFLQGNVQIFVRSESKGSGPDKKTVPVVSLHNVARVLNVAEQMAAGEITITSARELTCEGMIRGGRWYYYVMPKAESIMNGGWTHHEILPTRLSLDLIVEYVVWALSDPHFERTFEQWLAEAA